MTERHARIGEQRFTVAVDELGVAMDEKGAVGKQRDTIVVGQQFGVRRG